MTSQNPADGWLDEAQARCDAAYGDGSFVAAMEDRTAELATLNYRLRANGLFREHAHADLQRALSELRAARDEIARLTQERDAIEGLVTDLGDSNVVTLLDKVRGVMRYYQGLLAQAQRRNKQHVIAYDELACWLEQTDALLAFAAEEDRWYGTEEGVKWQRDAVKRHRARQSQTKPEPHHD